MVDSHADACAQLRNAEAAIRGFCQLAGANMIPKEEALQAIEEALVILAEARARLEPAARARAASHRYPRLISVLPTH
ncbi:MAG: hypothetical protein ACYS22_07425 [Planctomycetota bacterium]|jgi:hypothetical protein